MLVIVAYIYQFHPDLYIRWEADLDFYKRILDWCRGKRSDERPGEQLKVKEIPVLESLVLPLRISEEGRGPIPVSESESTYPDPTATDVFWVQSLILELGTEVTPEQFRPYLHGRVE